MKCDNKYQNVLRRFHNLNFKTYILNFNDLEFNIKRLFE